MLNLYGKCRQWISIISRRLYWWLDKDLFHRAPITYATDGLVTSHTWGGGGDQEFQHALSTGRCVFVHPLYHEWRLYTAVQLLRQLFERDYKPKTYVECGVGEGHTLWTFLKYVEAITIPSSLPP